MATARWTFPLVAAVALLASAGPSHATQARQNLEQAGSESLPFIADDYEAAIAQAKARKVPLFVESWAPW
jgi:hypothetical protein